VRKNEDSVWLIYFYNLQEITMQTSEKQTSDKSRAVAAGAVASLLALGFLATSQAAQAAEMEKCAGIVAAGKNDCGTPVSACAGSVKQDRDAHAWILVPKGTCERIAGGVVTTDPMNKHGGGVSK
jgi:uncharacterized membrane protein